MTASSIVEYNNVRYRLRVSAGPSLQALQPLNANDDAHPMLIDTDEFVGHVAFRAKGQSQIQGYAAGQKQDGFKEVPDSKWFEQAARAGKGANLTTSMQVVGRFKREWTGEQVMFACLFSKPFHLPPLTGLVVKFFKALDPGLQLDVQGENPYFISPLLGAMNTVNVSHQPIANVATSLSSRTQMIASESTEEQQPTLAPTSQLLLPSSSSLPNSWLPAWPSLNGENLVEDTSLIVLEEDVKKKAKIVKDAGARRSHFTKQKNVSRHRFTTNQVYGFELFNPFLDCAKFSAKLPGLSLDLLKYLNQQPITYVFMTPDRSVSFMAVSVEMVPVVDDLSSV